MSHVDNVDSIVCNRSLLIKTWPNPRSRKPAEATCPEKTPDRCPEISAQLFMTSASARIPTSSPKELVSLMSFSTQFSENTSSHDRDLATLSNYHDVRTTHLDLTWSIDWTNQLVSGLAVLKLEATKDVRKVILDTSHLDISTVRVGGGNVKWELGESVSSTMGQPFRVELAEGLKKGESVEIEVMYSTTKECTAVGWLTPLYVPCSPFCGWSCVDWWKSQTKSGKYPYLYSQCQSVSTRAYTAPPFAPLSPPFPFVSRPAPPLHPFLIPIDPQCY